MRSSCQSSFVGCCDGVAPICLKRLVIGALRSLSSTVAASVCFFLDVSSSMVLRYSSASVLRSSSVCARSACRVVCACVSLSLSCAYCRCLRSASACLLFIINMNVNTASTSPSAAAKAVIVACCAFCSLRLISLCSLLCSYWVCCIEQPDFIRCVHRLSSNS